jgi:hypothetical protein
VVERVLAVAGVGAAHLAYPDRPIDIETVMRLGDAAAFVSFNVGIELGRPCFVGLVLVVARALARLARPRCTLARWLPVDAMGSLSALWCIERTFALVAPAW